MVICRWQGCLKTCFQRELIARCGCADIDLPTEGAAFNTVNNTLCGTENG